MMGMEQWLLENAHRLPKDGKITVHAGPPKEKTGNATFRGVPQGCNMSPTIAAVALETHLVQSPYNAGIVMYADDGIIYGDDQYQVEKFVEFLEEKALAVGTAVHPKKSRWVKRYGVFEGSFKFLGLRYDPCKPNEVRGETRNGSRYEIPLEKVSEWSFEGWESGKRFVKDLSVMPKFILWHKYRLLGTMMALMYNRGELDSSSSPDKVWNLVAAKGSLLDLYEHSILSRHCELMSLDLRTASSVCLWEMMYRLRKYNQHLTKRLRGLERFKPIPAKNRNKKLKLDGNYIRAKASRAYDLPGYNFTSVMNRYKKSIKNLGTKR